METLAAVTGGTFARLQFTPDLLPADIVGTRIYRTSSEKFDVELGPVFANFVLADEINRAPAKVQSALLEVMAEKHVSIGGETFPAPEPFLVLATQNPIESEGVYPLPEAQRDRFLMKVLVGYPTGAEEVEIVQRMGVSPPCVRRPQRRRLRGQPRARHSRSGEVRTRGSHVARLVRCEPARVARSRGRRTRPRFVAGPHVHASAGRVRRRP
jgi:MoxR-like ATPase